MFRPPPRTTRTDTLFPDSALFRALTTIVQAPRCHYDASTRSWVLEDARQFDVARGTERQIGTVRFGRDIRPDQFTLAKVDPDALTFSQLQAAISDLQIGRAHV